MPGRRTIAVVGASADRSKFGNKCVRAYSSQGWDVFPVHPLASNIEGCQVYHSIDDVPISQIDRVSLYLPARVALEILTDVAKKQVGELWLNPGADSPEVVNKARALGLNVVCDCSIIAIGVSPHELEG